MSMLGVTFIAVGKVIVAVLIGALTTKSIPHGETTLRNFGFLISTLLLPSLTLSNTAKSVDLETLIRCSVLILFSLLLIACGLLWGVALAFLFFRVRPIHSGIPKELCKDVRLEICYDDVVDEGPHADGAQSSLAGRKSRAKKGAPYVAVVLSERLREVGIEGAEVVSLLELPDEMQEKYAGYAYATWVGCSTQNGVTLPLSVMLNIANSVLFIDAAHCAAYIFVFSISYMLYLWSACPAFVESGKKAATEQRLLREIVLKHKQMMCRCDATTQTFSLLLSEVQEGYEEVEESRPDRDEGEAPPFSEPRIGNGTLAKSLLATTASLCRGSVCSDSRTNTLGAGEETVTGDCDGREKHHVLPDTRFVRPGTSLNSSFTQTDRSVVGASGKNCASGVMFRLPGSPNSLFPTTASEGVHTTATATQLPYDWISMGLIRVTYEREMRAVKRKSLSDEMQQLGRSGWKLTKKLMASPPFLSVVVGIFIGIIPPVRGLFEGGPLEMVMDAITLIGEGSIPSSLLLLGANLVDSSTDTAVSAAGASHVRLRHAEQNTLYPLHARDWQLLGEDFEYVRWYDAEHTNIHLSGLYSSFSRHSIICNGRLPAAMMSGGCSTSAVAPMAEYDDNDDAGDTVRAEKESFLDSLRRTLSLQGTQPVFVWGIIVFRMFISPLFTFLLLVFLINTMPFFFGGQGSLDKTLIMVLMVELAAPTAINSTLLFNSQQFMTYPWAKMLFFQYVLCTFSVVMWASIGLSYVSSL